MSAARRSPAPTRFGSFGRYLVLALTAMMVGAFLAWRVSNYFAGPSEEERLADCRSSLGASADAAIADTENQVLQRCTGLAADWAPDGRYDLTVRRLTLNRPRSTIPGRPDTVAAVWMVDVPCLSVGYRAEPGAHTGTAGRGTTVQAETGRPRARDEEVSAVAPTPPTEGQVALVTAPGAGLTSLECTAG